MSSSLTVSAPEPSDPDDEWYEEEVRPRGRYLLQSSVLPGSARQDIDLRPLPLIS